MDKLRGIESFVRAVEEGSIAGAARKLGITPAAASQNIARLEHALGSRLLLRSTRQLALTESGKLYYERVRHVVQDLAHAEAAVSSLNATPQGRLRISCSTAFGRHVIAPMIPDFCKRYPDVSIELIMTDRSVDHIAEDVDVSIRLQYQLEPGLITRRIGFCPLMICASPDFLADKGTPQTPEDLEHFDCLVLRMPTDGRLLPWGFLRDGVRFEPRLKAAIISNDIDTLVKLTVGGAGITRISTYIADPLLREGKLVPLFRDSDDLSTHADVEPLDYHICYPDRNATTPKLRAFIDHVVTTFKARDMPIAA